ncbi:MAG: hypothetical protein M3077_09245 [Candidatus Dormibacteraeota bacterium]|nr:hypothetical protein [Candidatus Dormibacteraeota bacterium]
MLRVIDPRQALHDLEDQLTVRLIDSRGGLIDLPRNGRASGFSVSTHWQPVPAAEGLDQAFEVRISLVSLEEQEDGLGVQVALGLRGEARRFLVPGVFHGDDRPAAGEVWYPRYDATQAGGDSLTAGNWSIRADRASHSVVFGWTNVECVALATDEHSSLGLSGLGFTGADRPELLLNFPAREEPVTFLGIDAPGPAEVFLHTWQAGEIATLSFRIFAGLPEPRTYNGVLRAVYESDRERNELMPWMSVGEAAALTAEGLYRWHYRADTGVLAETAAFAPSDLSAPGVSDRNTLPPAGISGAAAAFALLTYGRDKGIGEYAAAASSVLDTISAGLSPSGIFWGRLTDAGWDGGCNRHRDWVHARAVAEATLFMIRAHAFEAARGNEHPAWKAAVVANLQHTLRSQQGGAFPAYVNARTGAAEEWEGAAGLMWIPALIEGASLLEGGDARAAAGLAGSYYAPFVEDGCIYGAREDVHLTPTSEDAYAAVMAYVALFEASGEEHWLELAGRAADWMMTFRWSYNLAFPPHTILETYDFRSRGADLASPRSQHLHPRGLLCLPEMVRLAEHLDDDYYLDRTRDNLACFLQFIAREEGDFNARKGMVSERYANTRGLVPKGSIEPVSSALSAGLILYACQAGLQVEP